MKVSENIMLSSTHKPAWVYQGAVGAGCQTQGGSQLKVQLYAMLHGFPRWGKRSVG